MKIGGWDSGGGCEATWTFEELVVDCFESLEQESDGIDDQATIKAGSDSDSDSGSGSGSGSEWDSEESEDEDEDEDEDE